ncbi:hypothetical protein [Paracoccus laeviglucosivorans]|uniref:Type III secretion protein C n=1 Tax=Paracoccus laeviglucosivorans TaxID=1197861 RepID=A0A521BF35_9RHOB|nr:hypothetical protein [Paracoccus laeviglucosivorans]SMO45689.1 type III secretion protein C [Paracoccus laeviglucosivorans]
MAPVIRALTLGLAMLGLQPAVSAAQGFASLDEDVLERPFPYQANGVRIEAMLQDLTAKTQVPVIPSETLGGTVSMSSPDGTLRDALGEISRQAGAIWWFDGRAVHVEPAANMVSRLIGLDGFTVQDLRDQMREIGLEDPQYPLRAGPDAEMARVVAPRGYVDAVAELAAHMAAARQPEKQGPEKDMPRVIRGRGWQ